MTAGPRYRFTVQSVCGPVSGRCTRVRDGGTAHTVHLRPTVVMAGGRGRMPMSKAPQELKRYEDSGSMHVPVSIPFASAIEDAIIFQVHIWIMRRLEATKGDLVIADTLDDLKVWLGEPEGYEKLKEMV